MLKNVLANYAGRCLQSLLGLIVTPFYLRLLGIESYALIGAFGAMQAFLSFADLGLSATLNREFASRAGRPECNRDYPSLLRTFETVYWAVSLFIGLSFALASPLLAGWVKSSGVSHDLIRRSILLMGFIMAVQGPISLYGGGILGMQKQVQYNVLTMVLAVVKHVGGVIVLLVAQPSLFLLFSYYLAATLFSVFIFRLALTRMIPITDERPTFRFSLLDSSKAFTIGMGINVVLAMILLNLDKFVLSRLLPLSAFGYYCLGATAASSLAMISSPFFVAAFPRFTALRCSKSPVELVRAYENALQSLGAIIIPTAVVMALFSRALLFAWTGDSAAADAACWPMTLLCVGWLFNGMTVMPYALELSSGRADLNVRFNILLVLLMLPALVFASLRYGAIAGGLVWMISNLVYVAVYAPLACTRTGMAELRFVHFRALVPLSVALGVGLVARFIGVGESLERFRTLYSIGLTWLFMVILSGSTIPVVRLTFCELARRFSILQYEPTRG